MSESDKPCNWKAVGNNHFETMRYNDALEAYNNGLKENSNDINLLSNRAATYLKLERFEEALVDAEIILEMEPLHFKSIYRKARALCALEKFHEAKDFLTKKLALIQVENDKSLIEEAFTKVEILLKQKEKGDYDMCTFMKQAGVKFTDIADFCGPVIVSSRNIHGKGRGLLATEDINPGQLIIAQRAFAVEFEKTQSVSKLSGLVEDRLKSYPQLIKNVYKLYAGPSLGSIDEEERLEQCVQQTVDRERIKAICQFNCFGGGVRSQATVVCNPLETLGLWILPSYINHSCFDLNCSWKIFGNVMFIRASKLIRCGEEILISYCDSVASYRERLEMCQNFGFECNCRLCSVEKNEPRSVIQERMNLLNEFNELVVTSSFLSTLEKEFTEPEEIISKIENLRPEKEMNLFLSTSLAMLGFQYQENGNTKRSVTIFEKAFNYVKGLPVGDAPILFASGLIIAYIQDGIFDLAKKWLEILKKELKIAYGTNSTAIMECIDAEFVEALKSEGFEFLDECPKE